MSQRAFGASIGVSGGLIGQIEADISPPARGFLTKISDTYGINADWLLNGHGEKLRFPGQGFEGRVGTISQVDRGRPNYGDLRFDKVDYAFVRRMDLSVSAGSGLIPVDDGASEGLAFPMAWFERQGVNSDLAVLVGVEGDSMSPAIPDGSLVLLHVAEKVPTKAGVYAFNFEGESYIKRLMPSGADKKGRPLAITLVSDNPAYPPRTITGEQLNSLAIVGRVRCVVTTF